MGHWLITGGAGFIGSHLVKELIKRNEKVSVLDNLATSTLALIKPHISKIKFIKGDIRNPQTAKKAMKGINYVLHQAALRSVVRSIENPFASHDVNATGTLVLLHAAYQARVKKFVYASSSSVYGDGKTFPQKPSLPTAPISPYAAAKLAGEQYCRVFAKSWGLDTVSLRYFNVFGPGQDFKSKYAVVIPIFINEALHGRPLPLEGDGRQSRDFTHIDNVISANILAAKSKNNAGESYNVACGESRSLLQYMRYLEKIMNKKLKIKSLPPREGDVKKTWADISKTKKDLSYKPLVRFEEGVKKTFHYYENNIDQLRGLNK